MLIRKIFLFTALILITVMSFAQAQKNIQRSWIKTSIEDLSGKVTEPDTLYTRYSFNKSGLNISFYPGWDDYKMTWEVSDNSAKIGFDTYTIETLNDSVLVLFLDGFRRIKFMAEDYLSSQEKYLSSLGEYNGRSLYKASQAITPRFTGKDNFRNFIQKSVEGYNINRASYFLATFIISEEGRVENIKIIHGISEGFDREITKQLLATSKKWRPALFQGKPIQTEMFYDIKYLDSLAPGRLN
ncbi:MAG: hypothetical protein EOO10_11080 [Chitinophagaceae bacterium]|nr:MAG: hypothetical protein EOO10_11080 [Chitinophagaceae bacterium]